MHKLTHSLTIVVSDRFGIIVGSYKRGKLRKFGLLSLTVLALVSAFGITASFLGWWPGAFTALFTACFLTIVIVLVCVRYQVNFVRNSERKALLKSQQTNQKLSRVDAKLNKLLSDRAQPQMRDLIKEMEALETRLGHQIEEALRVNRMSVEAAKIDLAAEIHRSGEQGNTANR